MKTANANLKFSSLLILSVVGLRELFSLAADYLQIEPALETRLPSLVKVSDNAWELISWIVAIATVVVAIRLYWRMRRRDISIIEKWDPPGSKFSDNPALAFRYVSDESEIAQLAKTEDYGDFGATNISQATEWWRRYTKGNVLALFKGEIIGGIDIWPIKKCVYLEMLSGRRGEEHLDANDLAVTRNRRAESYWYIGSLSLSKVWWRRQERKELLIRLLVNALELWRANAPVYPANFLALAWTSEGKNILLRNGFASVTGTGRHKDSDPCFQRKFESEAEMVMVIEEFKRRLIEHFGSDPTRQSTRTLRDKAAQRW